MPILLNYLLFTPLGPDHPRSASLHALTYHCACVFNSLWWSTALCQRVPSNLGPTALNHCKVSTWPSAASKRDVPDTPPVTGDMLPEPSTRAILGSIQNDIERIHSAQRHLVTKDQELLHLEAALPILGEVLVQNQDIIKAAEDSLAPLTAFLSSLSSATSRISSTSMGPNSLNPMLRMHSLPVLTRRAENQTKLQIRMLQNIISESREISSSALIAFETTHTLIPAAKSAIESLKKVVLDVGGDIQSKQRLVHPIHRLPCELVVRVLRLAVQAGQEEQGRNLLIPIGAPGMRPPCTLRSITKVCRTWRANLQDDRFIWKSHFIDGSLKALMANLPGINPDVLFIMDNGGASLTNPVHDRYLSKLSPPQTVHVTFKSDVRLDILPFCPLSLHISDLIRFDTATLGQNFSSLQSLTCTDILPVIDARLPSLVTLRIRFRCGTSQSLPLDRLSQTLTNTPNLTILEISCPMPGPPEITDPPIHLASLTTLCLRLTFPKSLLAHFGTLLRYAKLTRLEISLPTKPAERVEELLSVGQIRSQLTSLRILGPKPQVDFARFPRLMNLFTLIVEGPCARIFLKGLLCTRLEDEHPLICPVLSRVCIKESMISGDTIENAIHTYRQERALVEGGALPKMSVEVYDCPNVSVAQMKDLRRIRE